jgi:tripartite-type tricarboxylate transporter receptor subunit TctC
MGKKAAKILALLIGISIGQAVAQEPFYKGKTIRIIVGFSAGGGFDIYSRAIARHIGKHIPGNPTVIVENMTGAGSLVAANHTYKVAKPDGLTIGHFIGGLLMQQLLGTPGIEFDARKFEYVGVPVRDNPVCALTKASGVSSIESWMASKAPLKLGSTAPGSNTDDVPRILQSALGLPIQLIAGYKGTADMRLAAESGELAGGCWSWDAMKGMWSSKLKSGEAVVVLQTVSQPHPDLPKVPLAIQFANTQEARQLIQTGIHDINAIIRPYALPPGTPKEQVQILRKAFMDTLKDGDFVSEAMKSNLGLDPLSGEELESTVKGMFKITPALVARFKDVLGAK